MMEFKEIKEGRYIRKTKDFSKPCPKCGAVMDFDIIRFRYPKKTTTYEIEYECPNNCDLKFEDMFQSINTEEQIIWYEVEEDDGV